MLQLFHLRGDFYSNTPVLHRHPVAGNRTHPVPGVSFLIILARREHGQRTLVFPRQIPSVLLAAAAVRGILRANNYEGRVHTRTGRALEVLDRFHYTSNPVLEGIPSRVLRMSRAVLSGRREGMFPGHYSETFGRGEQLGCILNVCHSFDAIEACL